jgi:hypothetical protein
MPQGWRARGLLLRGAMRALPLLFAVAACAETSCFVRGTRVATDDGERAIDALRVGDVILAYVHDAEAVVSRRVVDVHRALVREIRTLTLDPEGGGAPVVLRATPRHPFWVASRGAYVAVCDLREGDALLLRDEGGLGRAVVRSIAAEESAAPSFEVFNISVESPESNYFAGGVLVHNKEPAVTMCDDADVTAAAATKVDDTADGPRYRFEVTTARAATLDATGFGRRAGAGVADVPLPALSVTRTGDDGRRWTVELVTPPDHGATVSLRGTSTRDDGASCEIAKTVDAVEP